MELAILSQELLKRGWKAFGEYDKIMSYWQTRWKRDFWFWVLWETKYTLRELVSKESGLWQFCCKNRLTNRDEKADWSKNAERDEDWVIDRDCLIFSSDYEYWIIESALKNESELEKFLLDNIKIEWKKTE